MNFEFAKTRQTSRVQTKSFETSPLTFSCFFAHHEESEFYNLWPLHLVRKKSWN